MKSKQRRSYSDAEKAHLVESYQASGRLKKPWCKENGIALSTLQRWLSQDKTTLPHKPQQNWVCAMPAVPAKSKVLEVQIGKCSIPVDHQTDLNFLASVLKVLVETC